MELTVLKYIYIFFISKESILLHQKSEEFTQ